jgi:ATP-dependent Clp protease ATP-binding subunit ClpX
MSQPSNLAAALPTPRMIVEHLDRSVVGQGRAKRTLAVAVANHYVRLFDALDRESATPTITDSSLRHVVIEKSNVLLIGPSGSGKTHVARALAGCLGVPFAVADATTLTEAGYVGEDVESILHKLLLAADMDVQAAQRGIVYIDEIDKLGGGRVHGAKDMRLGVQHALLKMIEGTVANVPPSGGYKVVGEACIPFDTSNVLFLCGGAFVGLEEIISRRLGLGSSFGFDPATPARSDEASSPLHHVLPEDVEKFGLIPELLGRLPVITTLDDLGVEDLARILREPTNSILAQYRKLLKYRHASLEFTEGATREIARLAHERGTGARGLRAIIERILEPVLFDPEPWVDYRVTVESVRSGAVEVFRLSDLLDEEPAPLRRHMAGRRRG